VRKTAIPSQLISIEYYFCPVINREFSVVNENNAVVTILRHRERFVEAVLVVEAYLSRPLLLGEVFRHGNSNGLSTATPTAGGDSNPIRLGIYAPRYTTCKL